MSKDALSRQPPSFVAENHLGTKERVDDVIDLCVADSVVGRLSQSLASGTWLGSKGGWGDQNVTISQKVVMKKISGIVCPALLHLVPPPSIRLQRRPSASAPRAPPQSPKPPPSQHSPKSHPHHPSIFIPLLLRLIDFLFSPPSPSLLLRPPSSRARFQPLSTSL